MARIVDYASLQEAIAEWLWRVGDAALVARADAFVDLFEKKFARTQKCLEMEEIDSTLISSAVVPLPPGYIEMIRLMVTGAPPGGRGWDLDYVTPAVAGQMDAALNSGHHARNYTIIGSHIFITPQASAPIGAALQLAYSAFVPLRVSPGGANWLLQLHSDIYLYGSLMQAAAYIDDDGAISKWKGALDEALAELARLQKRRRVGSGPLVMRPSAPITRKRYHRWTV